ncbi:MAG TPA: VCBS repeat-containing protein [Planctomycetota bacterium]|nr:VCBS repeat-containing protein [Planctomycetota bacterium]
MIQGSNRGLIACSVTLLACCYAGEAGDRPPQAPLFAPAPGSPITLGAGSNHVVLGDMNRDGKLDLVVASAKPLGLRVLLGLGDGRFGASETILPLREGPSEVALGDVNGDGYLDLACASHDSYAVTLALGDGKGGLCLAENSPIVMKDGKHPHTHGLGLADLNGDQKLDLVSVNNADNDLSIAFGDGHGSFTPAPGSPFAVGPSPYPLAIGDLDRDGRLDIVATASATGPQRANQLALSRALTILLADGHGGFATKQVPLRTSEPWFVATGDVDSDGLPDLLATHHEMREFSLVLADAKGGFVESADSPLDFGRSVFQVELADVNRDGKLDALGAAGEGVRVLLGDGKGHFHPAPHSPYSAGTGTWSFALGDVNGDGRLDLAAGDAEHNTISVLLGQ